MTGYHDMSDKELHDLIADSETFKREEERRWRRFRNQYDDPGEWISQSAEYRRYAELTANMDQKISDIRVELASRKPGRQRGVVKFWNSEKGFGFITMASGGELFFHRTALLPISVVPSPGDRVSYGVGSGRKGPCAVDITILST